MIPAAAPTSSTVAPTERDTLAPTEVAPAVVAAVEVVVAVQVPKPLKQKALRVSSVDRSVGSKIAAEVEHSKIPKTKVVRASSAERPRVSIALADAVTTSDGAGE